VASAKLDLADDRAARILRMDWPELKTAVAACQACGLRKTCTQTVFGVGDEQADWLLVGEAPGAEEDARGETFVGRPAACSTTCLPRSASRAARTSTSATCSSAGLAGQPQSGALSRPVHAHLLRQLELIRPKLILAMGRFA